MPLFVCDKCDCVDNTALTNYWWYRSKFDEIQEELRDKSLCSECDPATKKWHGQFPKEKYDPKKDEGMLNRGATHES